MNKHGVRNKYSPRVGVVVECLDESKTQQHFKDQCDINKIVNNLEATGSADHVKQARERYGDFTEILDVGVNLDKATKAKQLYEHLPVALRKATGNSIQGMFEFINDEKNFDECVKLGIFNKPEKPNAGTPAAGEINPQSTKTGKMKKTPKISSDQDESPDKE